MVYRTVERKNHRDKKCIAPFINDWNVWDIPVKEYTPAVETAIKNAYNLGVRHTVTHSTAFINTQTRTGMLEI